MQFDEIWLLSHSISRFFFATVNKKGDEGNQECTGVLRLPVLSFCAAFMQNLNQRLDASVITHSPNIAIGISFAFLGFFNNIFRVSLGPSEL